MHSGIVFDKLNKRNPINEQTSVLYKSNNIFTLYKIMIVSLKSEELKVGMFIDLSKSWFENPFFKTKFQITSEKQIRSIMKAGIKKVSIDSIKSSVKIEGLKDIKIENDQTPITFDAAALEEERNKLQIIEEEEVEEVIKWEPEKFMDKALIDAVFDKGLPTDTRSKSVYQYSLEMMDNLFKHPEKSNIKATKEGIRQIVDIILTEDAISSNLANIVSLDSQTFTHSVNVGLKSILLAKAMYSDSHGHDMHELGTAFFLHDIGKIDINPAILDKPDKLTDEEMEEIKSHPHKGYKILNDLDLMETDFCIVALHHHEREDGTGYPAGIKGADIHPYARICSISDVFDALTAKRSFKEQKTPIEALTIMKNEMMAHFNIDIMRSFVLLFKQD